MSDPRKGYWERYYILAIYAVPILLGLVSISVIMLSDLLFYSPVLMNLKPFVMLFNACLAGVVSASAEVRRHGSLARRIASGLLFAIVGVALYGVSLLTLSLGYEIWLREFVL